MRENLPPARHLRVGDLVLTRIGTWVIVRGQCDHRPEHLRGARGFMWSHHPSRRWHFTSMEMDSGKGDRVFR